MTSYRIIYEDPERPEDPAKIVIPSPNWLQEAMAGNLPPIWVHWQLQDDEQQAIAQGRHRDFAHDPEKLMLQYTAPRVGPLSEEEAMEYLVMKDVPRHVWSREYNRPMFRIVRTEDIPTDRSFRNAWRIT
jgi:hypothetical protein